MSKQKITFKDFWKDCRWDKAKIDSEMGWAKGTTSLYAYTSRRISMERLKAFNKYVKSKGKELGQTEITAK